MPKNHEGTNPSEGSDRQHNPSTSSQGPFDLRRMVQERNAKRVNIDESQENRQYNQNPGESSDRYGKVYKKS